MASQASFTSKIAPVLFPLRITPRIISCRPPYEVVWAGGRWGVHARHGFYFSENKGQVRVSSVEEFEGPLLPLVRRVGLPGRLHDLTGEFLAALKRYVETGDSTQA